MSATLDRDSDPERPSRASSSIDPVQDEHSDVTTVPTAVAEPDPAQPIGVGGAERRRREQRIDDRAAGRPQGLRAERDRPRRRLLRDREGRVRLRRRRLGLGQVDDHPPAPEGARADLGADPRRRPRPRPPQALEGADAAPERRLRLPGLQAPSESQRGRERRLRAPRPGRAVARRSGARCPRCSTSSGSRTR